jgi:hypothetical protein
MSSAVLFLGPDRFFQGRPGGQQALAHRVSVSREDSTRCLSAALQLPLQDFADAIEVVLGVYAGAGRLASQVHRNAPAVPQRPELFQ